MKLKLGLTCRFVLATLLSVSSILPAQNAAAAQGAQESSPTFVSRSELVVVPVVVKDKSGNHVSGLKQGDFAVLEDGKSQSIAMFEEVHTKGVIAADRKTSATGFSNFMPEDEQPRRLLIIVFDMYNTPFIQQARAREALLEFLQKSLPPNEPVALLTLNGSGVHQLHPFTTDPRVLAAALSRVRGQVAPMETAGSPISQEQEADIMAETQALNSYRKETPTDFANVRQRESVRETLAALDEIAHAYAGLPGRKSLLWATSGFPFLLDDPRSLMGFDASMIGSYERTWRALNQANIAVYPIDLKGVLNYSYEARFDVSMRTPGRSLSSAANYYQQTQTTLTSFAEATGGAACLDADDLKNCFKIAAGDSESYYLVGYYLGAERRKPGWHKLKVNVAGDKLRVRARTGFLVSDPKMIKHPDMKIELGSALAANLDYTGIPIDLNWGKIGDPAVKPGRKRAEFLANVTPAALTLDSSANNRISVELAAIINDAKGKYVTEYAKSISGELKPESAARFRKSGLQYRDHLELEPGKYTVKFVIRDNLTGKIGTVSAPLVIN